MAINKVKRPLKRLAPGGPKIRKGKRLMTKSAKKILLSFRHGKFPDFFAYPNKLF